VNLAQKGRKWFAANWWWLIPILLGIVIMLPRMASPQFGMEDDGNSIIRAQKMVAGTWTPADDVGAGRFRPLYWLSFGLVYALAGQNPFWFFLYNTLVLTCTVLLLMYLTRRHRASMVQTSLVGALFVLSGPIIESFYTLTKIEPLQVLLILAAISLAFLAAESRGLAFRALLALLTWTAAFLAFLSKETTLVMIPIALVWVAAAWFFKAPRPQQTALQLLLGAFIVAALAFWLARSHYVLPHAPGYAAQYQFSIYQILVSAYRWGGWLIRDFPYLLICAIMLGLEMKRGTVGQKGGLLFASAVWMGGWAAIFLPWVYTVEYYILPFAAGCALFCGLLIGDMVDGLRSGPGAQRGWSTVGLGIVSVLFLTTLGNNYSNARLQLAIDSQNENLLDVLAASVPTGGRVLVNLDSSNSYVRNTARHLQVVRGRSDLTVLPFAMEETLPGDYVLTFSIENQPMFFVRLGTSETSARQKNSRLKKFIGPQVQPVHDTQVTYTQSNINLVRLACLAVPLDFCDSGIPLVDTRPLSYGGSIYRVPEQ